MINPIPAWSDLSQAMLLHPMLPYTHQGQDGVPHFNYFDNERQLSFQWDGDVEVYITVSFGGYGEPVFGSFNPIAFDSQDMSFPTAIEIAKWFGRLCDRWIEAVEQGMADGDFSDEVIIL